MKCDTHTCTYFCNAIQYIIFTFPKLAFVGKQCKVRRTSTDEGDWDTVSTHLCVKRKRKEIAEIFLIWLQNRNIQNSLCCPQT